MYPSKFLKKARLNDPAQHQKGRLAELLKGDKVSERPGIVKALLAVRDDDKRKIKDPEELFREGFSILFSPLSSFDH